MTDVDPRLERRAQLVRALRRFHARLARKAEALRGDLAEAERGPEMRRFGETLLAYLRQVPARAAAVVLPDPDDPRRNLTIPLDPAVAPHANAARYFKRAAKAARGLGQIPARLAAVEAQAHAFDVLLERARGLDEAASDSARSDDPALDEDLERALAALPVGQARTLGVAPRPRARGPAAADTPRPAPRKEAIPARLQPRRLRTTEGWDVLIGRSNEGNDFVTHRLARSEDYWLHVHGAAGSHVVLRRGKGPNEPSKRTIEEVAAWAAFYSQARTAGKVPVIVTRKKYVRKPRKGPPGLALCTQEKTVMVRPAEPPRESLADFSEPNPDGKETP